MFKHVDVKVLNFGEKSVAVDSLTPELQGYVDQFNTINRKEAELRSDLFTLAAAKLQIQRDIENIWVRDEQAKADAARVAAEAKAAAEKPADETPAQ